MKHKNQQQYAGRLLTNEFVYEFRPIFCVALGVYAVAHGKGSPVMGVCGVLLLGAGVMNYNLRKSARQKTVTIRRRS